MSVKKVILRTTLLFVAGLFFNAIFPIFKFCFADFTAVQLYEEMITNGRILGVLQRLALTYLLGTFILKIFETKTKILAAALFLLTISTLGFNIYSAEAPFDEMQNISRALDIAIFGEAHIYQYFGFPFDPENLYGTLNSTALMLFGITATKILLDDCRKIFILLTLSATLLIIGTLWSQIEIISKPLWTAPYSLLTASLSMLTLSFLTWVLEKFSVAQRIFKPIAVIGKKPLSLYFSSNFVLIFLLTFTVEQMPLYLWIWQHTIQGFISVSFSSMLYALMYCALWILIFNKNFRGD